MKQLILYTQISAHAQSTSTLLTGLVHERESRLENSKSQENGRINLIMETVFTDHVLFCMLTKQPSDVMGSFKPPLPNLSYSFSSLKIKPPFLFSLFKYI